MVPNIQYNKWLIPQKERPSKYFLTGQWKEFAVYTEIRTGYTFTFQRFPSWAGSAQGWIKIA